MQFFGEIAIVSHCAQAMGQVEMSQGCVRTADVVCLENCDLLELKKVRAYLCFGLVLVRLWVCSRSWSGSRDSH